MRFVPLFMALLLLEGHGCAGESAPHSSAILHPIASSRLSKTVSFAAAAPAPAVATAPQGPQLAYTHNMTLDMPATLLHAHFDHLRDRCLQDQALGCILAAASFNEGDQNEKPSASLELRLPHPAVAPFEAALTAPLPGEQVNDVTIRSKNTYASDLSQPIAETSRRLAQLQDYRDRLTALAHRPDAKTDDLIKVEEALSRAQGEIETLTAENTRLDRQVSMEVMQIQLQARNDLGSVSGPIGEAWANAGLLLGESAGSVLRILILAIPWVALATVIFGTAFLVAPLIRRRRR